MIIDSSYLFDLMAEDPGAFSKGAELVDEGEMQWLPTTVVAETYYGDAWARSDTTEQEIRNRLLGCSRIGVDEEISRTAGELLAMADDRVGGLAGVGPTDAYIAAMAEVLNDAVLTDIVDDFEALGVSVETFRSRCENTKLLSDLPQSRLKRCKLVAREVYRLCVCHSVCTEREGPLRDCAVLSWR